jgi:catechol 2,3-dioxygenase-like lactoylglutathione lyase family enzyme
MLEIIPAERPLAAPQTVANNKDGGIRHLAIASDDFDAAHQQLKAQGVHFVGEPFATMGNRLVFFNDRDGNLLHLIQRENPLP